MKRFLITACLCLFLLMLMPSFALAAEGSAPAADTAAPTETEEADNLFFLFYERLGAHLPEVFSALSLLSACLLAFCYKKGLLPLLHDGLGAIGSVTKDFGKAVEKCAEESKEICENANNSIQFIKEFAESMQNSIKEIEDKLDDASMQKSEGERLRLLMEGQVELLSDIFLSSSLPQFEKERVCKRVEQMRAALRSTEGTNGGEGDAEP